MKLGVQEWNFPSFVSIISKQRLVFLNFLDKLKQNIALILKHGMNRLVTDAVEDPMTVPI